MLIHPALMQRPSANYLRKSKTQSATFFSGRKSVREIIVVSISKILD
ncbi:hypothetical protein RintRC_1998 [Richelia intracellularis]|nr:hypothetical protein RintRC_1998 [Richelia intracellularis]